MGSAKKAKRKRGVRRHKVSRSQGASLVRGIRRRLKLTQAAFAARLGVAQMTVSRWESGECPVSSAMRLAISAVTAAAKGKRGRAAVRKNRRPKGRSAKAATPAPSSSGK